MKIAKKRNCKRACSLDFGECFFSRGDLFIVVRDFGKKGYINLETGCPSFYVDGNTMVEHVKAFVGWEEL